jgi:hypothetical protein
MTCVFAPAPTQDRELEGTNKIKHKSVGAAQ